MTLSTKTNIKGIAKFNPNNLPIKEIGRCGCDEHETWTGAKPTNQELRLVMNYSDEYIKYQSSNTQFETPEDVFANAEKYEKIKWEPNSEQYWCKECRDILE